MPLRAFVPAAVPTTALLYLVLLGLSGCAPQPPSGLANSMVSRTEKVPYFSSIRLVGQARVEMEIGPLRSVTVQGTAQQANGVQFDMRSDELQILTPDIGDSYSTRPTVRITAPDTMALRLTGPGEIILTGNLRRPDFEIYNAGSGRIHITTGTVDLLAVRVLRDGTVDAPGLVASQVHARIDGSGSATVHANNAINVDNTGQGTLTVYGNPPERNLRIQGKRTPPVRFVP